MEAKTPLRDVRIRLCACIVVFLLAVDATNPVKVICKIFHADSSFFAVLSLISFAGIFYANAKELTYFLTKVFLQSILSIFLSSIEVLGKENIPQHGPIIFTGNHMNQFVDAALILVTCPHRVGFLVAEKSYHQRIIGDFAKAAGSIPVARPQDFAKKGSGRVYFDGLRVIGENTSFTKLAKGDKIRPGRSADAYRFKDVISDTEGVLGEDPGESSPLHEEFCQGRDKWTSYDVLGFIDQGIMFKTVHSTLAQGGCLGLFPEGGSHDRTDLLPLKAGVAAIAFGVLDKHDVNVPIVPVGLNYFRGHRFRGRVVVEFGQPIHITKDAVVTYKQSKRQAYQGLLSQVEEGMRSVIVTASDYTELKLIHTIRRLYQRASSGITTARKQDLARRLSVGYRLLKEKYGDNLPADLLACQQHLEDYQDKLDRWGLKDYQVMSSLESSFSSLFYTFFHGFVITMLASIPSLILNAPVGVAAKYWSFKQAQKDLKASRVKLAARDVMMSKKIIFSFMAVPVLWITYALILWFFTSLEKPTVVVLLLCCPVFSYMGVMGMQSGMTDLQDLRPAFLRLFPSYRKQAEHLPQQRATLQKEIRGMFKKYGPELGPLYSEKSNMWEVMMKKTGQIVSSEEEAEEEEAVDTEDADIVPLPEPDDEVSEIAHSSSAANDKKDV